MAQRWNPRQAMLEEHFEIFHYLDRSVDVELHHHDFFEIYYFLSGHVTYCIEGRNYHLEPGDILLMAPEELHQPLVKPGEGYERYVLWIDRRYLEQLSTPDADLSACFQPDHPHRRRILRPGAEASAQLKALLQLLLPQFEQGEYDLLKQQSLITLLLAQINLLCPHAPIIEPDALPTSTVSQVVHYIDAHVTEQITLEDLAALFYLSKYHLLREFRKRFGITIHKYIQKRRLLLAKGLLNRGLKPSVLFTQCGFREYATFYRAFVAEYGLSPREYQAFANRER